MSPEQLSTTTMNPPFRKLLKVVTSENEREECADHVRLFMGKIRIVVRNGFNQISILDIRLTSLKD